jgi:hypothetical protein
MEKLGSILQCSCGAMKKASLKKEALIPIAGAASAMGGLRGAASNMAKFAPAAQTAAQKSAPLLKGVGGGALNPQELAATQGPVRRMAGQAMGGLKKLVGGGGGIPQMAPKMASFAKFAQAMRATNGNADLALTRLEKEGYTKLAFAPAQAMQAVKNWGQLGKTMVGNKASQVAGTFNKARGAGNGVLNSIGQTAMAHPGVAAGVGLAGATGAAGLGAGYMMGKQGSALGRTAGVALGGAALGTVVGGVMQAAKKAGETAKTPPVKTSALRLIEVGDAAGRIMAKLADSNLMANITGQPTLTPEEIQEAVQGAQEREDVEGRAGSWGNAGAALGGLGGAGLGGGAGYGLGRLLKASPMASIASTGLGALVGGGLGGMMGNRIGKAEGTEEAVADKLVSMMRARQAYGAGANQGYMQGMSQFPGEGEEGDPQ